MSWLSSNLVLIQGAATMFLLAVSIQYPMRVGVFSFAGAGLYGVGGYTAGITFTQGHWATWPAVLAGVLVSSVASLLLGLLVQRLNGLYLAMATIAFVLIVGVVAGNAGDLTGGFTGLYGAAGKIALWQLGLIVLVTAAGFAVTETRGLRRKIESVREDHSLAAAMGVSITRYRLLAFLISGLTAGLGGALNVLIRTTISPDLINFQLVVLALTIVVVGGYRSWVGVLIGTVIFTWLPSVLTSIGEWRELIYGLLVMAAAVFFPTGIWGALVALCKRVFTLVSTELPAAANDTAGPPPIEKTEDQTALAREEVL